MLRGPRVVVLGVVQTKGNSIGCDIALVIVSQSHYESVANPSLWARRTRIPLLSLIFKHTDKLEHCFQS